MSVVHDPSFHGDESYRNSSMRRDAEQVWLDYQNGDITVQEASDRWNQEPPDDFARDELQKLEDARALKAPREQAVSYA